MKFTAHVYCRTRYTFCPICWRTNTSGLPHFLNAEKFAEVDRAFIYNRPERSGRALSQHMGKFVALSPRLVNLFAGTIRPNGTKFCRIVAYTLIKIITPIFDSDFLDFPNISNFWIVSTGRSRNSQPVIWDHNDKYSYRQWRRGITIESSQNFKSARECFFLQITFKWWLKLLGWNGSKSLNSPKTIRPNRAWFCRGVCIYSNAKTLKPIFDGTFTSSHGLFWIDGLWEVPRCSHDVLPNC